MAVALLVQPVLSSTPMLDQDFAHVQSNSAGGPQDKNLPANHVHYSLCNLFGISRPADSQCLAPDSLAKKLDRHAPDRIKVPFIAFAVEQLLLRGQRIEGWRA
jgi:hypothetical protein